MRKFVSVILIFVMAILVVVFLKVNSVSAVERYDVMSEIAFGWMYYADGWGMSTSWGDKVDIYVRFCHPEYEGAFASYIRQALAYLKNIMGVDFSIHWNEAVPRGSNAPSLYIGDPLNGFCCYDGNSYGYISVTKACMYKRDTYTYGNSAFVSERKASGIFFYRVLADIASSLNSDWHSKYWSAPGMTIFKGGFNVLDLPSPIDDQLLHIVSVWNKKLREPWHSDYFNMAKVAIQMRVEDAPIIALPVLFYTVFEDLWDSNDKWCPAELTVSGDNISISGYLNLIYPEDTFAEHWYRLTLNCRWDTGMNTLVCPISGVEASPGSPSQKCSGAFVYLVDKRYPFRLVFYRVSIGSWSGIIDAGRYLYLRFYYDTNLNSLVLERFGIINPFSYTSK